MTAVDPGSGTDGDADAWRTGGLDGLQRAVLAAPADAAAGLIADWVAGETGAVVGIRLADRAGSALHPAGRSGEEDPADLEVWSLEDGPAAEALWRRQLVYEMPWPGCGRLHVPIAVGGRALGVITVEMTARATVRDEDWRALGETAALLIGETARATDAWEVRRRSASYSISAEMQWQLLPPTSIVADGVELHALIEPAPRVCSDLFDWSVDEGRLWLAVLDADGRGLSAALPASVALAALRHARRAKVPLAEQVSLADQAVYDQFRGRAVVRAVVMEFDLGAGVRGVVAGERGTAPHVLRRRAGEVVELLLVEHEDLGLFDRSSYAAESLDVRAGDDLLVVTDGGPEAHDGGGRFGLPAVIGHFAAMDRPAAHPRRLLDALRDHSGGELSQDATALVVSLTR